MTTRTDGAEHVDRLVLARCVERLYDPEQTPSADLRAEDRSNRLVHCSVLACPFPPNNPCPNSPTRHRATISTTVFGPVANLVANFPQSSVTEGS